MGGKRSTADAPVRRTSERASKAPTRFRPSSADVPSELLDLIRNVATAAASKSTVPFEPSAVTALEEALEPMLEALCEAAMKHAKAAGREEIEEADLKAVSKHFTAQKVPAK